MLRKINRIFQNYMREKRLKIGKWLWDKKKNKEQIKEGNFIENNSIKSILFLRYDGKIGDMVINTLMFREIKKRYPDIKIGVVAREGNAQIIKNNPNVDKIYIYKKNRKEILELSKEIAVEKYDLLIDFSEMLRVNQMMLINRCCARFNMGLNRENWELFDISINSGKDFDWKEHITQRYSAYLKKIGIEKDIDTDYEIHVKENGKDMEFFKNLDKKIVVLNPYGASKHKSFSIETLKSIVEYLEKFQVKIVILYYGAKYKEIEELKIYKNVYIPENIENINDSIKLISRAELVITPDTSIVHIASALKKYNISVYPPNGGTFGVDHLVWAPKSEGTNVIFCKDKKSRHDEIDINTFEFSEMTKLIDNILKK